MEQDREVRRDLGVGLELPELSPRRRVPALTQHPRRYRLGIALGRAHQRQLGVLGTGSRFRRAVEPRALVLQRVRELVRNDERLQPTRLILDEVEGVVGGVVEAAGVRGEQVESLLPEVDRRLDQADELERNAFALEQIARVLALDGRSDLLGRGRPVDHLHRDLRRLGPHRLGHHRQGPLDHGFELRAARGVALRRRARLGQEQRQRDAEGARAHEVMIVPTLRSAGRQIAFRSPGLILDACRPYGRALSWQPW
ncbi:MAG: hypothetical protein QM765_10545 [Myxococcales bacterium]